MYILILLNFYFINLMDYEDLIKFCFFNNHNNVDDAIGNLNFMESIGMIGQKINFPFKTAQDILLSNYKVNLNFGSKEIIGQQYIFPGSSFPYNRTTNYFAFNKKLFNYDQKYCFFHYQMQVYKKSGTEFKDIEQPGIGICFTDKVIKTGFVDDIINKTSRFDFNSRYLVNDYVPVLNRSYKSISLSNSCRFISYRYKNYVENSVTLENYIPYQWSGATIITNFYVFINSNNNHIHILSSLNGEEPYFSYYDHVIPFDSNPKSELYGFDIRSGYLNLWNGLFKTFSPVQNTDSIQFKWLFKPIVYDEEPDYVKNWLSIINI